MRVGKDSDFVRGAQLLLGRRRRRQVEQRQVVRRAWGRRQRQELQGQRRQQLLGREHLMQLLQDQLGFPVIFRRVRIDAARVVLSVDAR